MSDNGFRIVSDRQALPEGVRNQVVELSELIARSRFASTHGLQYDGDRDISEVAGYKKDAALKFNDFLDAYARDVVAGKLVDMPAETTWRKAAELSEEERPDGTPFTEAWATLAKRLRVWQHMEQADKYARLGRYSVLLIGTAGTVDTQLSQPIGQVSGPDDVLYLKPYSERHADIKTWVEKTDNERYGWPETYRIDLAGDIATFRRGGRGAQVVHASRCIHIAEGGEVFGREILRRPWNDMHDLLKIRASTAEAYWQRVAGILQAVLDKDAVWTDEQLATLDEALQDLYHELRKTTYLQGGKLERLAETVPDPMPAAKLYFMLIAADQSIPMRLLFGSETGERSSTEDQKSYLGGISERQTTHAEPVMLRPLIDRLIDMRGLPIPETREYTVVWPTLFQEPELDIAEANKARAETAAALTPVGGDALALVEIDADRNVWLVPRAVDDPSPFEIVPPEEEMPEGSEEEPEDEGEDDPETGEE